jgi:hypothetical protein
VVGASPWVVGGGRRLGRMGVGWGFRGGVALGGGWGGGKASWEDAVGWGFRAGVTLVVGWVGVSCGRRLGCGVGRDRRRALGVSCVAGVGSLVSWVARVRVGARFGVGCGESLGFVSPGGQFPGVWDRARGFADFVGGNRPFRGVGVRRTSRTIHTTPNPSHNLDRGATWTRELCVL